MKINRRAIQREMRKIMRGADPNAPPFKPPLQLTSKFGRFYKNGAAELTAPKFDIKPRRADLS